MFASPQNSSRKCAVAAVALVALALFALFQLMPSNHSTSDKGQHSIDSNFGSGSSSSGGSSREFSLNTCFHSDHNDPALIEHEKASRQVLEQATHPRLRHLFRNCKKVFLDLGANVGVSTRKLLERAKYPTAPFPRLFAERSFVEDANQLKRGELCAIMLEPNPRHAKRLREVERCYQAQGYPVVFIPAALGANFSMVDFVSVSSENSDWGAHVIVRKPGQQQTLQLPQGAKIHTVPVVTLSSLFCAFSLHRKMVGAKLDVEGAEFSLLPAEIQKRTFCLRTGRLGLQWMTAELHPMSPHVVAAQKRGELLVETVETLRQKMQATCGKRAAITDLLDFDDETYLHDGVELPCAK